MSAHIMLVDDDLFLVSSLSRLLSANGFQVTSANNIADAQTQLGLRTPRLLILDLSLPDGDGNEFCRRIRESSDLPILMLTSRGNSIDKVTGLGLGADDYLTKPFDPHELVARIRAILRRSGTGSRPAGQTAVQVGDVVVDDLEHRATAADRDLALTATEYDLLRYLAQNAERAVPRNELFQAVWGYDAEFASNTLDVLIYRVRHKLKSAESQQTIVTIRGHGFRLR